MTQQFRHTLPIELFSAQQARDIDRKAQQQIPISGLQLMTAAAEAGFAVMQAHFSTATNILILCGAGNNAGDGYLMAKLALQADYHVQLVAVGAPGKLTGDAALAYQAFVEAGGVVLYDFTSIDAVDLVVDALLGTGLDRAVTGAFATAIEYVNSLNAQVLAMDIPSGLHADTGNVMGCAVQADMTLTFIVLKQGLFTGLAADYCGQILFADLQVGAEIIATEDCQASLLFAQKLAKRSVCAHKGYFGHVLVVGGDYAYAGAAMLAAEAALNAGSGLVSIATRKQHAQQVHLACPELMGHALNQASDIAALLDKITVLVLGPGLGQTAWAKEIWTELIQCDVPRVIDADALNLLAESPCYADNWVLTPHPGEAARLLKCTTADILHDRFWAVRALQKQYGGVCLLKGVGTLVTAGEHVYVNTTGNPGMASGGMGDVLAGIIGALLAQKYTLLDAAKIGVYLHGLAADMAAKHKGERGLRASEVLQFLRVVVND